MKYGESSPEGNPLTQLAERKAAEYVAREHRERLLAAEAALQSLYKKLGLEPGQTLREYFQLTPSSDATYQADEKLDPELDDAITQLFEDISQVLAGDKSMDEGKP